MLNIDYAVIWNIICSFTDINVANLRGAASSYGFKEESFAKLAELQKKLPKTKGPGTGEVSKNKTPKKTKKNVPKASKTKQKK